MSALSKVVLPKVRTKFSKVLENLNKEPKLYLNGVQGLKLTLAAKNDHFGARHFLKEDLPRICYVNPDLSISVARIPKSPQESWKAEMELKLLDGQTKTIDMTNKWSTVILEELMDTAGGESWRKYKAERAVAEASATATPEADKSDSTL